MPRTKSLAAIEARIEQTSKSLAQAKKRYDRLADELVELREQRDRVKAELMLKAFKKSGKTWDELMVFLSR